MVLYSIFSVELAYWLIDILIKLTSYISFFFLANKINKNLFLCCLLSCLFASANIPTHEGFGTAIIPYLIYLMSFEKNINIKHYLIIFFFGINSDLIVTIFMLPVSIIVALIINKDQFVDKLKNNIAIIFCFFFALVLGSSNLIYTSLMDEVFHRSDFFREGQNFLQITNNFFFGLFNLPFGLNWTLFSSLPIIIFLVPTIIASLFVNKKIIIKILFLLLAIEFFIVFLNSDFITEIQNNANGLLKSLNFSYIRKIIPFLNVFLLMLVLTEDFKFKKIFISIAILSVLLFQINSSIVPFIKKNYYDDSDYKNIYTFKGYYSYEDYGKIKSFVKDKRVMSVGLDPMVAVMNNIKVIDGYHNLYPLSYKYKFRKIIEAELDANNDFKKYYDNWGSRLYAHYNTGFLHADNIKLDFKEAKKIGAEYVISKIELNSNQIKKVCNGCVGRLHLYKII